VAFLPRFCCRVAAKGFRCDGTGALRFALRGIGTNSTLSLPRLKPCARDWTFEARTQLYFWEVG
jgi:hypothetical protein